MVQDTQKTNPLAEPHPSTIANALADLYVTYRKRFNMMIPDGTIFMPKCKGKPLPLKNTHLASHVRQKYAVAIFAGKYSSKFMCLDVDTPDKALVQNILEALTELGIQEDMLHVSNSGGKGFHIDLFFDSLMYTEDLKTLYNHLGAMMDLSKVEFRPTYKQSIKLPLSVHCKTGNVCWYLDKHT